MLKKIVVLLLTLGLVMSVSACGLGEKAAEKAVEKAISGSTGGNVDVNSKDGSVTVKDDKGNTASFGGTDWPTSDAAKLIPKFTAGEITYVMDSDTYSWITLAEVKKKDYDAYVVKVQNAGFTVDQYTMSSDSYYMYTASDSKQNAISVSYDEESGELTITMSVYSE